MFDGSERFQRRPHTPPSADGMTFHATRPRAVIDWILAPDHWHVERYVVDAATWSDHRLVWADLRPGG